MLENHMVVREYYDGHWDCECDKQKTLAKNKGYPDWKTVKCVNCVINDPDYFEED